MSTPSLEELQQESATLGKKLKVYLNQYEKLTPKQRSKLFRVGLSSLLIGREIYDKSITDLETRTANRYPLDCRIKLVEEE